ncbi:CRISPR system precrRNA processing endoribonuclease RAMP protein Cas6 [Aggregatilinea lenta]|uniref:CRISPR system precrRNA processing endoribonuclease RAMP protein Cas6 n=1 Tax=Aggregatilinea lenta TaxID=913108 RepID=UPI000E5B811C|nr:CRISPR system precrRNA processing endoribonuclease RAMP protein Cas6 [Aggregatilinea lenta]
MTALAAVVLTLRPAQVEAVPRWVGSLLRTWFLEQIARNDETLAAELQAEDGARPYTVSSLLTPTRTDRVVSNLDSAHTYTIRITSLDTRLTQLLVEQLLSVWIGQSLPLDGAVLVIEGATVDPARDTWAGQTTDADLVRLHTLEPGPLSRYLTFEFDSPTAFRRQNRQILPFPLPELVFGSLLDRWNTFNEVHLHPDTRRFATECVATSRYRLHTRSVTLAMPGQDLAISGCVGESRYTIMRGDRYWRGIVHALAAYAFYAGIGGYTTMGMGRAALKGRQVSQPA